jgi:hypothetical protein
MNFFNRFRHFPEFHHLIAALEEINKFESGIVHAQERAFSDDFRRWCRGQPAGFSSILAEGCESGTKQAKFNREVNLGFRTISRDLQPLLPQEQEIFKWRELCREAEETYNKYHAAADRAETTLRRLKSEGSRPEIDRAEASAGAARRKVDDSLSSLNDQKKTLRVKDGPFRVKFLSTFVNPLLGTVNFRYQNAERLIALSDELRSTTEKFADFKDDVIDRLQSVLQELEKVVIE